MSNLLYYIFLFSIGIVIYLLKPRFLFIYWLSVQPIIMPIYFSFFPVADSEEFWLLYAKGISPVSYLCFLIFLIELFKGRARFKKGQKVMFSALLVVLFIAIQNVLVHFDFTTIQNGFTMMMHIAVPLLLILNCERIRPQKRILIKYTYFIIIVELIFCCLNLFSEFKVYSGVFESYNYESHLISGTFARFNHLTNYLSTLFLFLSVEYFYFKKIEKKNFYVMTLLIGIMILMSGSRLSLILFVFIIFSFIYIYQRRFFFILLICLMAFLIVFLCSTSSTSFTIAEQDEGTGIERNVMGLKSFFQSDITEGNSTVSLSAYLLLFEFHNPIFGNGYSYMGVEGYNRGDFANQEVFIADAHLAYMFVEYGFVGCMMFLIFYVNFFKTVIVEKIIKNRQVIIVVVVYYILNTITDMGLFDTSLLSFFYIFTFSLDNIKSGRVKNG